MGKRKTPQPDADGFLRTGIYQRRVVPEDIPPEEAERRLEESFEKLANPRSIHSWLNEWLECLADIIRPYLDTNSKQRYALNLGDGWKFHRVASELPDQVRDAIDCQNEIRILLDRTGDDDSLAGDLGWVVNTAFRLGRMTEKMKIRPFEPLARTGAKVHGGGSEGAAIVNAGHAELHKQYQREVEKVMQERSLKYTPASEIVGETFGVDGRTVRNHTTNPNPRHHITD